MSGRIQYFCGVVARGVAIVSMAVLVQACAGGSSGGGSSSGGGGDEEGGARRATTFSKSFGGDGYDVAHAAIGTSDGGYAFVGAVDGESPYGNFTKLWINKLDANGNTEWQRALGGGGPGTIGLGRGRMRKARPTPDGGAILVGHATNRTGGLDASDIYVAKLSGLGALQWSRTHDSGAWTEEFARSEYGRGPQADDTATDVDPAPDGGYLLAASSVANVITESGRVHLNAESLVVMRLTADGDVIWQRRLVDGQFARDGEVFAGPFIGYEPIVRATHDNGAIVALTMRLESGQEPLVRIIRFDSGGVVRWQHDEDLDTVGTLVATDITQTHDVNPADGLRDGVRDDGFIITIARQGDSRSGIVLKLAADGAVDWRRDDFGRSDNVDLFAVEQLCVPRSSGGGFDCDFVAAGASGQFNEAGYAVRLTALGAVIVERHFDTLGVIQDIGGSSDSTLLRVVARRDAEGADGSQGTLVLDKGTLLPRDNFLSDDVSEHAELDAASGLLTFDTEEQVVRRYASAAALPEADISLEFEFDVSSTGTADAGSIVEVASGSFIVGGRLNGLVWLLRITDGDVDWQRTVSDGTGEVGVVQLAKASDGAVFTSVAAYSGHFVAKMSVDGTLLWQSDEVSSYESPVDDMQALPDGGVVVLAQDFVTRLDRDGRVVWRRVISLGASFESPGSCCRLPLDSIALSDDGGFVVTRPAGFSAGGYEGQFAVIKLDGGGNVLWNRSYRVRDGFGLGGYGTPIRRTPDGGYVVAITETFTVSRDAPALDEGPFGGANLLLVKIDRDGTVQWSRSYGALLDDGVHDLQVLPDGGLLVAGRSHSFGSNSEAWILRTGQDGLIAEGCNAHLVSLPASAFRVSDQEAGPSVPATLRGATNPATVTDTDLVPSTPETVEARQCLGSANPVVPPPVSPQFTLTLVQPGTETGVVTSTPAGIVCGTAASTPPCTASFDAESDVFLDVDPGSRDRFLRWENCTEVLPASAGTGRCRVRMSADREVRAIFGEAQDRFLVRMSVSGDGGVRSSEVGGIQCGVVFGSDQRCEQLYDRFVAGSTVPNSISLAVSDGAANFSGWGGDCAALGSAVSGNLTLDADKNCTATFSGSTTSFDLTVRRTGAGSGEIISAPVGISCGGLCVAAFQANTTVRLRAVVDAPSGSTFGGWTGCDRLEPGSGSAPEVCEVDMSAAREVSAAFLPATPIPGPTQQLRTRITFDGRGSIASDPPGIVCSSAGGNGGSCVAEFAEGSVVRLIATPEPGFRFVEWRLDPDCADGTVTMDTMKSCEAVFEPGGGGGGPTFTLSFVAGQIFNGHVETDDQSILCPGSSCSASYAPGTLVRLRAVPDAGRALEAWTGDCESFGLFTSVDFTIDRDFACGVVFVTAP